jgi:hypothetical protein
VVHTGVQLAAPSSWALLGFGNGKVQVGWGEGAAPTLWEKSRQEEAPKKALFLSPCLHLSQLQHGWGPQQDAPTCLCSPPGKRGLTLISSSDVSTLKGRMLSSSLAVGFAPGPHHPSSSAKVSSLFQEIYR